MLPHDFDECAALLHAALAIGDATAAQEVADHIDRLDADDRARRHVGAPDELGYNAYWYARRGLPVFPIMPGDKKPYPRSRGFKDATTDLDAVRRWWTNTPTANIGVPTGHAFDVIDIDGPAGLAALGDMWETVRPTAIAIVSTPRPGGLHLYVPPVPGRGNKAGLLPSVDYRGEGGYVVVPPSTSDAQGRPYTWCLPFTAWPST